MRGTDAQKQAYFADGIETVCGSPKDQRTYIYKINSSGVFVRDIEIESGSKLETPIEIVQISDVHINYVGEQDYDNKEVMHTKECRLWNAGAQALTALDKAMEYASFFDAAVITGDTLDYLTLGALDLMQKHVWDVDPEVFITLGGHDITRQMQTGLPDKTPLESRQKLLQQHWKHDIFYTSKVIKDKVMLIQLDNGAHCYWDCQIEPLKRDIALARENGYVVLVFQHEPISTQNRKDGNVPAFRIYDGAYCNFYSGGIIGGDLTANDATVQVYRLLTENCDVIKGIFCGHRHSAYYTEICGTYVDKNGTVQPAKIPQPVLEACVYDGYAGHVMKITVT